MLVKTLLPMLVGDTFHPAGAVVDIDDELARRYLDRKPAPVAAVVRVEIEAADLAPPPAAESADASPRTGRRRAAATE